MAVPWKLPCTVQQDMQGQQHQAQPDGGPPEVAGALLLAALESQQPSDEEDRGRGGDVEGQDLDRHGGADVGAQHQRQAGRQRQGAAGAEGGCQQGRGGTRLEDSGDAQAGQEGRNPVPEPVADEQPQIGAKCPHHPAVDHVQPPQQQGDAAHQVKQQEMSQFAFGSGQSSIILTLVRRDANTVPTARRTVQISVEF